MVQLFVWFVVFFPVLVFFGALPFFFLLRKSANFGAIFGIYFWRGGVEIRPTFWRNGAFSEEPMGVFWRLRFSAYTFFLSPS